MKKKCLVAIEFDDPNDDMPTASDFATFVEVRLGRDLTSISISDVTVYATPSDVQADADYGVGIYAEDNDAKPLPIEEEASFQP